MGERRKLSKKERILPPSRGIKNGRFAPLLQVVAVQQNTGFSQLGVCADLPSAGRSAK
jgi:hypothetical protein